jgi:hypothetical protein
VCFDISDQQYNVLRRLRRTRTAFLHKKLIILTFSGDFANILQQACLANGIEGAEKGVVSSFRRSFPVVPPC